MSHWTHYFDKIYLINLPDRADRLRQATEELQRYRVPFEVFQAIKADKGAIGLYNTMMELFRKTDTPEYWNILVFEDDVRFVNDPNEYMPRCVEQLQKLNWDLFYMGINMDNDQNLFNGFTDSNILNLKFGYSTHALAWSRPARTTVLQQSTEFIRNHMPIDVFIAKNIHPAGNCYCSYPLLATQQDGYSDIENKESTYGYIEQRYNHSVSHLLKQKS